MDKRMVNKEGFDKDSRIQPKQTVSNSFAPKGTQTGMKFKMQDNRDKNVQPALDYDFENVYNL